MVVDPNRTKTSVQVNRRLSKAGGAVGTKERFILRGLLRATLEKKGIEINFVKQTQNQNDKNSKP
jgi:hypothetical protein